MAQTDFDAVVVGSGPNGLAAAIFLQQKGLSVLIVEGQPTIGGGLRTAALTLPGFHHDICSAIHPMALASPFFKTLPLEQFGLEWLMPEVSVAHPFDGGQAAGVTASLDETAQSLGRDSSTYQKLIAPVVQNWQSLLPDLLAPLQVPGAPFSMARFGANGLLPASWIARRFSTEAAKGLWAGMAAHSIQPLNKWSTAAIGLVLSAAGHQGGWVIPKGGSQSIADALAAYFRSMGGTITTGIWVKSLADLPSSKAVLLDIGPRQLLQIAGHQFSSLYRWQLERYRYGMGVFKIDWAIEGSTPFTNPLCQKAGTVHLGNTFAEIASSEAATHNGAHPEKPFVLLAQQGIYDTGRAPAGKQAVWGYCHVPHGSKVDMTAAIEQQVERFAPGFRERILARHTMNTPEMEAYNPNYIGGDINGGALDLGQLFTRPALRYSPYRTSARGIYICSASTPPGGGVHGMCGYHAAQRAWKDIYSSK